MFPTVRMDAQRAPIQLDIFMEERGFYENI